jgi:polyisoprenoid-binding protein YceI
MKKVFVGLAVLSTTALLSFIPRTKQAEVYNVSTGTSKVDWVGSKKNGYHPGYFNLKSGVVNVENGKITGGNFVIDIANVKVTDGAGAKLEGHLKSADFFDVAKYPEATFTITNVSYSSESTIEIAGNLLVKGVNVPVKFPGRVRSLGDGKLFAQAFFTLDATPFITYGVEKDVPVMIHLYAAK